MPDKTDRLATPPLRITLAYRPVPALADNIHPVVPILEGLGHAVVQIDDNALDMPACDVLWIMENANWFPRLIANLQSLPRDRRPVTLVWHWEPLPHPATAGTPAPTLSLRERIKILLRDSRATDPYTNYRRIDQLVGEGLLDVIAVCSCAWREWLREKGIDSVWVPIGHIAEDGEDLSRPRDIAALFLGSLDVPRRKKKLRYLRNRNVDVQAKGSWFDARYWGNSRTELINRAATFLNIQRYPGEFAGHRLALGMANKSLVISEPIYQPHPFEPGRHYVSAKVAEMPEAIEHYLNHPQERQDMVEAAYDFLTNEVTMTQSVVQILSIVYEQNRLAIG